MARVSEYDPAIAQAICEEIANSTKGLARICRENPEFPVRSTVYVWLIQNKEFAEMYKRAKQLQADYIVEETLDISDDSSRDWMVNAEGKEVVDYEVIQRARLRVDTRKWYASKLAPKVYGERQIQHIEITEGKPEADMTAEELKQELAATKALITKHLTD